MQMEHLKSAKSKSLMVSSNPLVIAVMRDKQSNAISMAISLLNKSWISILDVFHRKAFFINVTRYVWTLLLFMPMICLWLLQKNQVRTHSDSVFGVGDDVF